MSLGVGAKSAEAAPPASQSFPIEALVMSAGWLLKSLEQFKAFDQAYVAITLVLAVRTLPVKYTPSNLEWPRLPSTRIAPRVGAKTPAGERRVLVFWAVLILQRCTSSLPMLCT